MKLLQFFPALPVFVIVVCSSFALKAQHLITIEGKITDATTGTPIPGASIRCLGINKGTYSSPRGVFRIALPPGTHKVRISSLSYETLETYFNTDSTSIHRKLNPSAVLLKGVEVVAEIPASEIIKRAIAKKQENQARLKTSAGVYYTKVSAEFDAKLPGANTSEIERNRYSILETFSRIYERFAPEHQRHTTLLQRRQSANIASQNNLAVVSEFFNFLRDRVKIATTELPTPLASDALDVYDYQLRERRSINGTLVYALAFQPKSKLFPGFEGTLHIADKTYSIVEADIKPTEQTSILFVKTLHYIQKFEPFIDSTNRHNDEIWVPTYLQTQVEFNAEILRWVANFQGKFRATTIVSEITINQALPDSLFIQRQQDSQATELRQGAVTFRSNRNNRGIFTVAQDADSIKPEFWQANALTELSTDEAELYRRADSVVKATPAEDPQPSSPPLFTLLQFQLGTQATLGLNPVVDYTRVSSFLWGVEPILRWNHFRLNSRAALGSNGENIGQASFGYDLVHAPNFYTTIFGSVFSRFTAIQQRFSLNNLANPFGIGLNNLVFGAYSDFYREEGWTAGVGVSAGRFAASFAPSVVRHRTRTTIVEGERQNLTIQDGAYTLLRGELQWNMGQPFGPFITAVGGADIGAQISGMIGTNQETREEFRRAELLVNLIQPTFTTGYVPMYFSVMFSAGVATDNTPRQAQFFMRRRYPVFGQPDELLTPPINAFGGTSYLSVVAEHNFSDLLWRWIGLPTYNGRGPEFIARVGSARYDHPFVTFGNPEATPDWYSELGLGISRIPTFISDFFYARADLMWGIGALGSGNFGFSFSLSLPF